MTVRPDRPILALDRVAKTFTGAGRRVLALDGVSLTVRPGRVTGLIGPDAAGKTTLMRLLAGLLVPDAGTIRVLGLDPVNEGLTVQAAIGYMPQRFGLYEDLTVQENLDLYADLQGLSPAERPSRYEELLHMTGLAPFTARLAGKLSGGMKQKLGLACTLVRAPELLLLDEPTVGVDPVSRRELWTIVYRLVEQQSMSVLLSTAYLDEAERCAEVILLHQGRVLGQGVPDEFSTPLRGRVYGVGAAGIKPRVLQQRLSTVPGVTDAVLQGGRVRLLTHGASPPDWHVLDLDQAEIVPLEPRFEDGFIALLRDHEPRREPPRVQAPAPADGRDGGAVIRVQGVTRRFGDFHAVRDLDFEVSRGEVFGLLGANGAGKTTTFRMLCGLLPASAGSLSVAGQDMRRAAAAARGRIGYMAQKFSLYGNLSVRQNLGFFASAYNLFGRRRRQRLDWALTEFELAPLADALSGTLPLGYQQRLAMACALLHEPEILFLDEPTSGVDPLARREFWNRIIALAEAGVTVLVTTHFMEEAEYCDRLAIMAAGEILTLGSPAEIKARVRSEKHPEPDLEDAFIALIEGN